MKRIFLHGTTFAGAEDIKKHWFDSNVDVVWENASDPEKLYVRELTGDENEDCEAKYLCVENAQIACAYTGQNETRIGLIRITIDDPDMDSYIETDDSCGDTMKDCFQIDKEFLNSCLEKGTAEMEVEIYEDSYMPYLRIFYLQGMLKNKSMEIDDTGLKAAIKAIENVDSCFMWDEGFMCCLGEMVDYTTIGSINESQSAA